MAMFHLSTKPISRKSGRTATASSAYRTGAKMTDERTGVTHDYTKKSGIVKSDCFAIINDKKVSLDRSQLWNKAEQTEKRKDARTAREIIVNLPYELNKEQREKLVDDFAISLAKKYNCGIDYAIHKPNKKGDDRNHHAHIMMTTRELKLYNNEISLENKTSLELENKKLKEMGLGSTQEQITDIRKSWADLTNHHLKKAGLEITIDHRSYKERGIEQTPTIKMGVVATAMERKGIETEKGNQNRKIKNEKNLKDELFVLHGRKKAIDKFNNRTPEQKEQKQVENKEIKNEVNNKEKSFNLDDFYNRMKSKKINSENKEVKNERQQNIERNNDNEKTQTQEQQTEAKSPTLPRPRF